MPTTHINTFDMYYEVRGDGEPLLLLHGGLGIGNDWRLIFPSDPTGYQVIVPDLRGHGRSGWEPPWTIAAHLAKRRGIGRS